MLRGVSNTLTSADPRTAANTARTSPWMAEIERNFTRYNQPGQTLILGAGTASPLSVEPLTLMQYFAASGPAEACALGAGVTFPTVKPAYASLAEIAQA